RASALLALSRSSSPLRTPPRPPLFPYTTLFRSPTLGPRARNAAASTITPRTASANRPPILPGDCCRPFAVTSSVPLSANVDSVRSEEHTSELQSPYDLVCRLLLEKKKPFTRPTF